jgi:hypothetical protein
MNETSPERSTRIVDALKSKGVNKPCPRCGHLHFGFVAETLIPIQSRPGIVVGAPVVPIVIVACNNCGFVTQHALGALDIPAEEPASTG